MPPLAILLLLLFIPPTLSLTNPSDKAALDAFYNGLSVKGSLPGTIPSDWCAEVSKIICSEAGNVTKILLTSFGLAGNVSSALGALSSLEELRLSYNQLSGTLPSLDGLVAIKVINFENNKLTGNLPSLGSFSKLKELYLGYNQFSGTIPSSYGIPSLQYLNLMNNQLTGTIPSSFSSMTSLVYLALYSNQLSGTIPAYLGTLPLLSLSLHINKFTGTIPSTIGNSSVLESLYLAGNQLTGTIPSSVTSSPRLQYLYLNENQLSGTIPSSWENPWRLTILDLQKNNLTGTIPSILGSLTYLNYLHLSENLLSGTIPTTLGKLFRLNDLLLHQNQLSGTIPAAFGLISSLTTLNLHQNLLTGSIPPTLGNFTTTLKTINLHNNHLTGTIPLGLSIITSLRTLNLKGTNNFCPLANYSAWAPTNDFPGSTSCNPCAPFTCQHSSTCTEETDGTFTCNCISGWSGVNCEIGCTFAITPDGLELPPSDIEQEFSFPCQAGYTGTLIWRCSTNGTWETPSVCERIMCPAESDSIQSYPPTGSGEVANGTCAHGLKGFPTRLCDDNGSWQEIQNPCVSCGCITTGASDINCTADGQCTCQPQFTGLICDACLEGYYGSSCAQPCECDLAGSLSKGCDVNGKCSCRDRFEGLKCDSCKPDSFGPQCLACNCSVSGSFNSSCDITGACFCKVGFLGEKCATCENGWSGEDCDVPCECAFGATATDCTKEGQCSCKPGFQDAKCTICLPNFSLFMDDCLPINCTSEILDGTFYAQTRAGQTAVGVCPKGTFGSPVRSCVQEDTSGVWLTPSSTCVVCPSGTFQDEVGRKRCKSCPPSTTSPPGADSPLSCECIEGYQLLDETCQALACPMVTTDNVTFPSTQAGQWVLGACPSQLFGNPLRFCNLDGTWSPVIKGSCQATFNPTCRSPKSCGLLTPADCSACYQSGGMVDPGAPTTCYCPSTGTSSLPSANTTCTPALDLCSGAYLCHPDCLTCLGPLGSDCTSCWEITKELVLIGSASTGSCLAPCLPLQARDSKGRCQDPDCSLQGNCSGKGECRFEEADSVCVCSADSSGPDCSVPHSCPLLSNCSGQGRCVLDPITKVLSCLCSPGFTGTSCNTLEVLSFSPRKGSELGGEFIQLYRASGFTLEEGFNCSFGTVLVRGLTSQAQASAPVIAGCVAPPSFLAYTVVSLSVTLGGVTQRLGDYTYQFSDLLPRTSSSFTSLAWTVGEAHVVDYSSLLLQGSSTVKAELLRWRWNPFLRSLQPPVLESLGVVASGPNIGSLTITLNATSQGGDFKWETALHILSLSSGLQTERRYVLLLGQAHSDSAQCAAWGSKSLAAMETFTSCPPRSSVSISFTESMGALNFPRLFSSLVECFAGVLELNHMCCYEKKALSFHLWEPYQLTSYESQVVRYFATTQLPKLFCCRGAKLPCTSYLSRMEAPENQRKRSQHEQQAALAQAFGDPHFMDLNGTLLTFNGLGEFTLLEQRVASTAFPSFTLQARLSRLSSPSISAGNVTKISAIALSLNSSTSLAIYVDQLGSGFWLRLNGANFEGLPPVGGQVLLGQLLTLGRPAAQELTLFVPVARLSISIKMKAPSALSLQVALPKGLLPSSGLSLEGILSGQGPVSLGELEPASLHEELLGWMVDDGTSLFAYSPGAGFSTINQPSFHPTLPTEGEGDGELGFSAKELCQAAGLPEFKASCQFDVLQTRSLEASQAAVAAGRIYQGYLEEGNQAPIFGEIASPIGASLGEIVQVDFSMMDPEGEDLSVFVSQAPSPAGTLDRAARRYSFLVTEELYRLLVLQGHLSLELTSADLYGKSSTLAVSFTLVSHDCNTLQALANEILINLDLFCSTNCSARCASLLEELNGLSCLASLSSLLEPSLSAAQGTCSTSEGAALAPGAIAGIVVGVLLLVLLFAVALLFLAKRWMVANGSKKNSKVELVSTIS